MDTIATKVQWKIRVGRSQTFTGRAADFVERAADAWVSLVMKSVPVFVSVRCGDADAGALFIP